ncbi:MAG: site-2 protease family protein [Myxococcota bacterium]
MSAEPISHRSPAASSAGKAAHNPSKRSTSGLPGLRIGRVFGVDVHLDPSLIVIVLLIGSTLALGTFPAWHPDWSLALSWGVALVAAVAFLLSILAHELAHAVVGRALGVEVRGITLFMFGGVASMGGESSSPRDEFLMTIVGPLVSLLIGFLGIAGAAALGPGVDASVEPEAFVKQLGPVASILAWLGPINVMLAIFNLVPGFPLDGGRVLRAILWWATGDRLRATRWASRIGQGFATLLIALGVSMALGVIIPGLGGGLVSGLWLVLIGWFLKSAARSSYEQVVRSRILSETSVSRVYDRQVMAVPSSMTIAELVEGPGLRTEQASFAVEREGRWAGIIRVDDIRQVPRDTWDERRVSEVMTPMESMTVISVDANAEEALRSMTEHGFDQLPVRDRHGSILGFIRRKDILRWLYLHEEAPA